ncbi:hypothetical protein [Haloprofundus marisrubri]|uniref:hypothetical protein n=1 Tax=Haloprofundus marisrubri TaxID=1514971 RepID=UPI0012BAFA36|nr:hypothetical protein [Haloprofundus marisrubri]
MSTNRFEAAARDLQQLSGVIECAVWSDSISVRYSGSLYELQTIARKHDLFWRNLDGVFYADPLPVENAAGELVPTDELAPASVVAREDGVQAAHLIEEHGDQRLLVATPGVKNILRFMELNGVDGWMLTEAKEAQIRPVPPTSGASYILTRTTSQLRRLRRKQPPTHPFQDTHYAGDNE